MALLYLNDLINSKTPQSLELKSFADRANRYQNSQPQVIGKWHLLDILYLLSTTLMNLQLCAYPFLNLLKCEL